MQPWATLLRSLSAYESYHRMSSVGIQPSGVIELLTLSAVLPRSIRFSVGEVEAALRHITEEAPVLQRLRADAGRQRTSRTRDARSGGCTPSSPTSGWPTCSTTALHRSLLEVQRRCYRIGQHVEDEFFAHQPLTAQEMMA